MSTSQEFLLDMILKGTLILLLAQLVLLIWRGASASVQHGIRLAGLVAFAVLPLFMLALPSWQVSWIPQWRPATRQAPPMQTFPQERFPELTELPVRRETATDEAPVAPEGIPRAQCTPAAATPPPPPAPTGVAPPPVNPSGPVPPLITVDTPRQAPSWPFWIMVIWAAGSGGFCLLLLLGVLSVKRLEKRCQRIVTGPIHDAFVKAKQALGVQRDVTLLQSSERSMPMTWGILHPRVLLPEQANQWSPERLEVVLLHELAHVRRYDCLGQIFALVMRALLWFHPLVWWTVRDLRMDQERACDDTVIRQGVNACEYAEHLVMVSASGTIPALSSTVALAMSRATQLERRLQAMLDEQRNRRPMSRKRTLVVMILTYCLLLPLARISFRSELQARDVIPPQPIVSVTDDAPSLMSISEMLQKHSLKSISEKELLEGAIKGILAELKDPYSEYVSGERLALLQRETRGTFTGIGARLKIVNDKLTILSPIAGSPALKAGVKANDVILAIDGKPTKDLPLQESVKLIIGKQGTDVKLTIGRNGKSLDITVTRDQVRIPAVSGFLHDGESQTFLFDPKNKVGYLRVLTFSGSTAKDVSDAVQAMKKQGMRGLILDLRFCPGGLLQAAVETADLFLTKGTIVSIKGKGMQRTMKAKKESLGDFPMVVLLNNHTASAAEIVAGALRDNERAKLLGNRTFGKGSVQSIIHVKETGGALKLTTARYYLPSGRNIDRRGEQKSWGVDPHDGWFVPLTGKQKEALQEKREAREAITPKKKLGEITPKSLTENHSDPQLAAALKTMTAKLTGGEFIKVGKDQATLEAHAQKKAELQERKEELLKELKEVDKELAN